MDQRKFTKTVICAIVLVVLLFIFILLDLSWASSRTLSLSQVWDALMGRGTWGTDIIVNDQNLPRIAIGVFVGAGLALTGCVMQAVFRNPLADPYILGLSSGASLGSTMAILASASWLPLSIIQPALAFIMCLITMVVVYTISRIGGSVRTETLVLAGVAVSSLISAIVSFLTYVAPEEKIGSIVFWSLGNSMAAVVLGHIGAEAVAANSICDIVFQMTSFFIWGAANAASVMTGNTIGAGQKEKAREQSKTFIVISLGLGLLLTAGLSHLTSGVLSIHITPFFLGSTLLLLLFTLAVSAAVPVVRILGIHPAEVIG